MKGKMKPSNLWFIFLMFKSKLQSLVLPSKYGYELQTLLDCLLLLWILNKYKEEDKKIFFLAFSTFNYFTYISDYLYYTSLLYYILFYQENLLLLLFATHPTSLKLLNDCNFNIPMYIFLNLVHYYVNIQKMKISVL